ncbi:Uncharacterised protein [Legionella beliardensis]|uniref:Uncharacterized protein n=1 Tax=Legionella beliardensis TaxID=91822 RepID=A0A378I4I0_9GAMM|nr:Uncharacterised protein [Legionella beliardensis]
MGLFNINKLIKLAVTESRLVFNLEYLVVQTMTKVDWLRISSYPTYC